MKETKVILLFNVLLVVLMVFFFFLTLVKSDWNKWGKTDEGYFISVLYSKHKVPTGHYRLVPVDKQILLEEKGYEYYY